MVWIHNLPHARPVLYRIGHDARSGGVRQHCGCACDCRLLNKTISYLLAMFNIQATSEIVSAVATLEGYLTEISCYRLVIWYSTQSHDPDTEPNSPCPTLLFLVMLIIKQSSDRIQFCRYLVWFWFHEGKRSVWSTDFYSPFLRELQWLVLYII